MAIAVDEDGQVAITVDEDGQVKVARKPYKPPAPGTVYRRAEAVEDPRYVIAMLDKNLQGWPFDPREPDALHDEMDRAIAAGFVGWAAELAARSKLRPRPPLPGFDLGECFISRGAKKLHVGDNEVRARLRRHATGDHGTSEYLRENAVSVAAGHGLVRSRYSGTFEEGRGIEHLDIVSMIGERTFIYTPFRDGL